MKIQQQAKILVLFLVNVGERRSHLPNITTPEIFQRSPIDRSLRTLLLFWDLWEATFERRKKRSAIIVRKYRLK